MTFIDGFGAPMVTDVTFIDGFVHQLPDTDPSGDPGVAGLP